MNRLVSVSCSVTWEVAAPRPPQDPQVLAGPALRTLEAQAAWGPAALAAPALPVAAAASLAGAALHGLTPRRLRHQRLHFT